MSRTTLAIDAGATHVRVAVLGADGLRSLEIDRRGDSTPLPGALYRGRVTERMPALGAAFVDLGGITGFIPDAAELAPGDEVLLQVRREAEPDKAARLSPDIQLAGRNLVFTPDKPCVNVSRKITDADERARLSDAVAGHAPSGGFVIRTSAAGVAAGKLAEEAAALVRAYAEAQSATGIGLCRAGPDALTRALQVAGTGVSRILCSQAALGLAERLDLPLECIDHPFDALDIESRIAALLAPDIALGDGWMRIEPTAALVAVDVNTGAERGGNAALRINLAAAGVLPREIALRRLGGVIAVDFAGAPKSAARRKIEETLRRAARKVSGLRLLGWGPAGLCEMQCPKPGRTLRQLLAEEEAA